jgi:hypothetical protein
VIVDSTPEAGSKKTHQTIAVDESAISPTGWMTLDLAATRGIAVSPSRNGAQMDDTDATILALGPRDMAAAAMLRAVQAQGEETHADAATEEDLTRRAWRLAREARALARARGQLQQGRADSAAPQRPATAPAAVPAAAIIPVGGSDLQACTPAQPFPRDDQAANDNRMRMLLMTALIVGLGAGYAMTAKPIQPSREGYDVPAPLAPEVRISQIASTPADPALAGISLIFSDRP